MQPGLGLACQLKCSTLGPSGASSNELGANSSGVDTGSDEGQDSRTCAYCNNRDNDGGQDLRDEVDASHSRVELVKGWVRDLGCNGRNPVTLHHQVVANRTHPLNDAKANEYCNGDISARSWRARLPLVVGQRECEQGSPEQAPEDDTYALHNDGDLDGVKTRGIAVNPVTDGRGEDERGAIGENTSDGCWEKAFGVCPCEQ